MLRCAGTRSNVAAGIVWLMAAIVGLAGATPILTAIADDDSQRPETESNLESLAVVAGQVPGGPGCRGIAVIDLDRHQVTFRGQPQDHSTARIAVSGDLEQVVGSPGAGNTVFLNRWLPSADSSTWAGQTIVGDSRETVTWSGLAFLPSSETLLLGVSPYAARIASYDLSSLDRDDELVELPPASKFGSARSDHPAEIMVSSDGTVAHLVGWHGTVSTLETSSLVPVAEPISYAPAIPDPELADALASIGYTVTAQIVLSDISPDGRFLAVNRWASPDLNIVDLHKRESTTVATGVGVTMTGGVAFNHGWRNPGLFAVNALDKVIVYRMGGSGELLELSRHPIQPIDHLMNRNYNVAPGNVAWSARGDYLIATTNSGINDHVVLEVADCGRTIREAAELSVCQNDVNLGREIWTANKILPTPEGNTPRCPTAVAYPTATPPSTPRPSPTPFATPISDRQSSAEMETKVVALEGSEGGVDGCGGMTYFGIGDGIPRLRSGGLANPGSVAHDSAAGTLVVGPSDDGDRTYRVFEDRWDKLFPGSLWRKGVVTSPVGAPIPFGAMSWVWADTQLLLTYRDAATNDVTIGLFDRFGVDGPAPVEPLASVAMPRGIPAIFALDQYHGEDAMMLWGGTVWVATDLGEIWRLVITDMSAMSLEGPIADVGMPIAVEGDDGPPAHRVNAALSHDQRHLMISRWGEGALHVVDLETNETTRLDIGTSVAGAIATNYGWETEGLVAVHAGDALLVLFQDPTDGTLTEIHRERVIPPRNEEGNVVPGHVAWSTNGAALIATVDQGLDEFATFKVTDCGRGLHEAYRVASCQDVAVQNRGRDIITVNRFYQHPDDYVPACPGGVIPPTPMPSPPAPTPTPVADGRIVLPLALNP